MYYWIPIMQMTRLKTRSSRKGDRLQLLTLFKDVTTLWKLALTHNNTPKIFSSKWINVWINITLMDYLAFTLSVLKYRGFITENFYVLVLLDSERTQKSRISVYQEVCQWYHYKSQCENICGTHCEKCHRLEKSHCN